jgi:hypothetical protein
MEIISLKQWKSVHPMITQKSSLVNLRKNIDARTPVGINCHAIVLVCSSNGNGNFGHSW